MTLQLVDLELTAHENDTFYDNTALTNYLFNHLTASKQLHTSSSISSALESEEHITT